jgi:hypothetical protein
VTDQTQKEDLRFLLAQIEGRSSAQADAFDALDRKATTILAASGVLLGLAITSRAALANPSAVVSTAYDVALVMLVLGLIEGVSVLWTQGFTFVPEPRPFLDDAYGKTLDETLPTLLANKRDAFERNAQLNHHKDARLRLQMAVLIVGGTVLFAAQLLLRKV